MIAVAAALCASGAAVAQSALDTVVVTGTREPERLARVTGDVVVIDAQRIRESTADSLEDLLRREAGVQVSRSGGPGQTATVFIRGASASNTVVLVDGVRVGSATVGQAEFESIGLSQIERIEVLRGPASSLYGADAVGGVIQIFTRRGDGAPRVTANAAIGGYRSREGDVGVSGSGGGFDYAAAVGRESSRGVSALKPGDQFGNYNPDDDGYRRDTGQLKLGYTPVAGHRIGLSVVASRLNSQFDSSEFLADFTQDPSPDFRNKLNSTVTALDYRGVVNTMWTTSALLSHDDDDLKSGGNTIDRFRTKRDQFTWQNALKFSTDQQVVLAYEHLDEKVHSDSFEADESRRNNAFVVGYSGSFGAHSLQADLRHDDNSAYGGNTTGRLGWSMEVVPNLRVRALAGTTFRAPSFNELFFPSFGVSTLAPERGRSVELGASWRTADTELSATVYRNRLHNLIGFESDPTNCPSVDAYPFGCARNFGRARLQGATLAGAQRFGALNVRGTLDFLDAKDLDTGARLPRRAARQASLAADYDLGAWNF
ncbi:MAG TPA: TonB-dependent receptor, partial [Burkholderiaceae bacterium]|nr:TonB-dependent receptor [Burkholderiaceae bacterium]